MILGGRTNFQAPTQAQGATPPGNTTGTGAGTGNTTGPGFDAVSVATILKDAM